MDTQEGALYEIASLRRGLKWVCVMLLAGTPFQVVWVVTLVSRAERIANEMMGGTALPALARISFELSNGFQRYAFVLGPLLLAGLAVLVTVIARTKRGWFLPATFGLLLGLHGIAGLMLAGVGAVYRSIFAGLSGAA